jgi:hypothetical protein
MQIAVRIAAPGRASIRAMTTIQVFTVSAVVAMLAGCGSEQNFSGTYEGKIARTVIATGAGTERTETWIVTSPDDSWPRKENYEIKRTRGGETCVLKGKHGHGYKLTVVPGQTCTLDGKTLTLRDGTLNTHGGISTLHWTTAAGKVAITEVGQLREK